MECGDLRLQSITKSCHALLPIRTKVSRMRSLLLCAKSNLRRLSNTRTDGLGPSHPHIGTVNLGTKKHTHSGRCDSRFRYLESQELTALILGLACNLHYITRSTEYEVLVDY